MYTLLTSEMPFFYSEPYCYVVIISDLTPGLSPWIRLNSSYHAIFLHFPTTFRMAGILNVTTRRQASFNSSTIKGKRQKKAYSEEMVSS